MLALKAELLKSVSRAVAISMEGCCIEELKNLSGMIDSERCV